MSDAPYDMQSAYALLMDAHEGLEPADSHAFDARLVLLLMNEIDDPDRWSALIDAARPRQA